MNYILTFDIGTTSVKTCLFDEGLEPVAESIEEYQLITRSNGIIELVPETYWDAVKRGAAHVLRQGAGIRQVSAICITTQGETLIPVDQSGRALRNAIVWLDSRAEEEARQISAFLPEDRFYQKTGISNVDSKTPLAKVMWVKAKEPQVYASAYKFLLLEDYIVLRLTGRFATEKTVMCTTGYFDIRNETLYEDALSISGIDRGKFPEILNSGQIIGSVKEDVARELGLAGHTVVVAGAMDQVAAAIGGGNLKKGIITETTGTTMALMTLTDENHFSQTGIDARINAYKHVYPNQYYIISFCMTAGVVLKWFKDEFCHELSERAKREGADVYDLLVNSALTCPPGADGLISIPYFEGMLQPEPLPNVKGIFFGASLHTRKPHFIRSILEGVGFMMRENLEYLGRAGIRVDEIRSFGGGAKSDAWQQIKADICRKSIRTMVRTESASFGVAMLASVALNWFNGLESAGSRNRFRNSFAPDASNFGVYDSQYQKYLKVFRRTKDCF